MKNQTTQLDPKSHSLKPI